VLCFYQVSSERVAVQRPAVQPKRLNKNRLRIGDREGLEIDDIIIIDEESTVEIGHVSAIDCMRLLAADPIMSLRITDGIVPTRELGGEFNETLYASRGATRSKDIFDFRSNGHHYQLGRFTEVADRLPLIPDKYFTQHLPGDRESSPPMPSISPAEQKQLADQLPWQHANCLFRITSLEYDRNLLLGSQTECDTLYQLPQLVATGQVYEVSNRNELVEPSIVKQARIWARQIQNPVNVTSGPDSSPYFLDMGNDGGDDQHLPIYRCNFELPEIEHVSLTSDTNQSRFFWWEYFQDAFAEDKSFRQRNCDAGYWTLSNFSREFRQCPNVLFPVYFGPGSGVKQSDALRLFLKELELLRGGVDMMCHKSGKVQTFSGDLSLLVTDSIGGYKFSGSTGNAGHFGLSCCHARHDRRLATDIDFRDVILNRREQREQVLREQLADIASRDSLTQPQKKVLFNSYGIGNLAGAIPTEVKLDPFPFLHRDRSHLLDLGFCHQLFKDIGEYMGRAGRAVFVGRYNRFAWPEAVNKPDLRIDKKGKFKLKLSVGCYRSLTMVLLTRIGGLVPETYANFVRRCILWILRVSKSRLDMNARDQARTDIRKIVDEGKTQLHDPQTWFAAPNVHQYMEMTDRTILELGSVLWTDTARFEKNHHVPKLLGNAGRSPYVRRAKIAAVQKAITYAIHGGRWGPDGCYKLSNYLRSLKGPDGRPHALLRSYTKLTDDYRGEQTGSLLEYQLSGGFRPAPSTSVADGIADKLILRNILKALLFRITKESAVEFTNCTPIAELRKQWLAQDRPDLPTESFLEQIDSQLAATFRKVPRVTDCGSGKAVTIKPGDDIAYRTSKSSVVAHARVGDIIEIALNWEGVKCKTLWFCAHQFTANPARTSKLADAIGCLSVTDKIKTKRMKKKRKKFVPKRNQKRRRTKTNPTQLRAAKEIQRQQNNRAPKRLELPSCRDDEYLPFECFDSQVHVVHDCVYECPVSGCGEFVDASGRANSKTACTHFNLGVCRSFCTLHNDGKCPFTCLRREHRCYGGNRNHLVLTRKQGFYAQYKRIFYNYPGCLFLQVCLFVFFFLLVAVQSNGASCMLYKFKSQGRVGCVIHKALIEMRTTRSPIIAPLTSSLHAFIGAAYISYTLPHQRPDHINYHLDRSSH
jgi:hypothetical protein